MKIFTRFAAIVALAALISSCENEIEINDEWEDVTVVYSLLNPAAGTNWVRVERGYLGEGPASASFDEPDSLYYENLVVLLKATNSDGDTVIPKLNANGDTTVKVIRLVKDETVQRDSGVFTTEDYRLYRTNRDLDTLNNDWTYHLIVKKPGTNLPEAKASTVLVEGPGPGATDFGFKNPRDYNNGERPTFNGEISWYASENAEIYEIDVYFRYQEINLNTNEVENKVLKINYETLIDPQILSTNSKRSDFYQKLAGKIAPAPDHIIRIFDRMRIDLWAGGADLKRYILLNEPSSGLSQAKPEFPQIENGVGLFSSRTKVSVDDINLNRSLLTGTYPYYMDPVLCDRNFAVISSGDTCTCEFIADEPSKYCL